MNVLVTGSNGQLAKIFKGIIEAYVHREICKETDLPLPHLNGGVESLINPIFTFVSRDDFDITDESAVNNFFASNAFNIIINCAAYTKVDLAEDEESLAYDVNANAVKYIAKAANKFGAELYHISTDFVFDGTSTKSYKETDTPNPLSIYGKTKQEGEQLALKYCAKTQIIRTSWLYSELGSNFVKTIIRLASERNELKVVSDQIGTPTSAINLAMAVLKLIFSDDRHYGEIYHYSDAGECSWYEFALEIVKLAELECKIIPIASIDYPQKAQRPKNSVMCKDKILNDYQVNIIDWKEALIQVIQKL